MRKVRKDRFLKDRGGTFQILDIICTKCGRTVIVYQKDGKGTLYRTYLNRIMAPEDLASLQDSEKTKDGLSNLNCKCGSLIGIPMLHWEGRLAFRLIPGSYKKHKHRNRKEEKK